MREKRLPEWLRKRVPYHQDINKTDKILKELEINTVCRNAKCPNLRECFARRTATFMILGNVCTRDCSFCAIKTGIPETVDVEEPRKIAKAVELLELRHVVITSVTRDDLAEGGALQFVNTIRAIREINNNVTVEVLTPDFKHEKKALNRIAGAEPDVFNHNIETVPEMYKTVRPEALYDRSLKVIEYINNMKPEIYTKSGIMLGLGETEEQVIKVIEDLRGVECDILTIGQYLQPSKEHIEVKEYISPEQFKKYKEIGLEMGFIHVASGPFVRSSFHAGDFFDDAGSL
ncbi:MAG: lipoyl synthase [Halanaerobiaceae bacterium]